MNYLTKLLELKSSRLPISITFNLESYFLIIYKEFYKI